MRIVDVVGAPYMVDSETIVIGTSIGISVCPQDGEKPHQLLQNADLALYRAKAEGRGRFRFYDKRLDGQTMRRGRDARVQSM